MLRVLFLKCQNNDDNVLCLMQSHAGILLVLKVLIHPSTILKSEQKVLKG